MGGSLGAKKINETVREALPELLKNIKLFTFAEKVILMKVYKIKKDIDNLNMYMENPDILAITDFVISRAGSNAILSFNIAKPMVLIPLSKFASRGDQILNAESFERQGYASVLYEEDVTVKSLIKHVEELNQNNEMYKTALKNIMEKAIQTIIQHISEA